MKDNTWRAHMSNSSEYSDIEINHIPFDDHPWPNQKVLNKPFCMYCFNDDPAKYNTEYVKILDHPPTWELWMCCHPCRDKGQPCETFFPEET